MSVQNLSLGVPNEKQRLFLTATERYVAYGGARGGGKSWAVRTKSVLLGLHYPGAKILILRRTLPELRENHIRPLTQLLKDAAIYNDTKKTFLFHNGSVILCGYCKNAKDLARYQGQEFDFIFIDEATQMEEYVFDALKGCLRGVIDCPKRIYLTCNPGGPGHTWVKRLFIDRKYDKGEDPADYRFIKARLYDNTVLLEKDPSYLSALQSLPAQMRRAWLDGDWDIAEGRYFEDFSREVHVTEPFEIPLSWRRYMAFDYGLDMLACLWFAVAPDRHIYVYRELHKAGLIVSDAAKEMRTLSSDEKIDTVFLPPDMASRQKDSGKSMWELFSENGIVGSASDNRRVAGWLATRELLKPIKTEEGALTAKLQIFSNCRTLIAHLPLLMRDEKKTSDASNHPHEITHICDALRYFALSYRERDEAVGRMIRDDPLKMLIKRAKRADGARRNRF